MAPELRLRFYGNGLTKRRVYRLKIADIGFVEGIPDTICGRAPVFFNLELLSGKTIQLPSEALVGAEEMPRHDQ